MDQCQNDGGGSFSGETSQSDIDPQTAQPESKLFNDPIHGHMEFDALLVKIIDTPQFQRLRYIKQLGGVYFVYPGASHNRFEHSLGVAHLAGQLVRRLQKKQPELDIDEKDILCVQIAGLCHDLGHGPFSYVYKNILQKVPPVIVWEKSDVSACLFNEIEKRNQDLGILTEIDRIFIEEMIAGIDVEKDTPKGRNQNKYFLYDIVNNKRNGVDVNKFDYVARDCYHLGKKTAFDHQRFIKFAKVFNVNDKPQICIRDKEVNNIYDLFHTIASLHDKVYQHLVVINIELMISDVVNENMLYIQKQYGTSATPLTMSQQIDVFTNLTDSIFGEILHSSAEELAKAREIVTRIHSRRLYTYLGKVKLQGTETKLEEKCISELTKALNNKLAQRLEEKDIGIYVGNVDFGKQKGEDPIHGMNFYDKSGNIITTEQINKKRSAMYGLKIYSAQWMYVFCKKEIDLNLELAKEIVEETLPHIVS